MIFVQFWWALLAFNSPGSTLEAMDAELKNGVKGQSGEASEQLQSFSRAVEKAGPELQELWSSFGAMQELDNQKEQLRERRNTLDDMLSSFAQSPIEASKAEAEKDIRVWQEEADAWYRSIQAKRGKKKFQGSKQERSVIKEKAKEAIDQQDKTVRRTETGKAKPDYKEVSADAINQKHEDTSSLKDSASSHLDLKPKPMPQTLGEHENLEGQSQAKAMDAPKNVEGLAEKSSEFREAPAAEGVYESTLSRLTFRHDKSNKLDHEANYKLSKVEQEASEKLPKFPSLDASKDDLKQQKRSSSTAFNPMDEIKLKTSCRMIAKGFGPLLPSETYDITRKRKLEDWQPLQVDSGRESAHKDRRVNIKTFEPQNDNLDYNQYSKGTALDTDQMMDLPQSFDYRVPQYDRFYSLNQRERLQDYERNNRKPIDLDGPGLGTSSRGAHDKPGLGSSSMEDLRKPVRKPSHLEFELKNRLKDLERDEDQKEPEHKLDINTGLSDIKETSALSPAKEHESKQKEQLEEFRGVSQLDADSLTNPESFFEDKLKTDLGAAAPASNTNPEVPSNLVANQDVGGGRLPRRTRRVKRSLEENYQEQPEPHIVNKRKAQLLDDFEDHNGNRASFGVLGNGLLTPDAEELGGKSMSFPGHELLTHFNELEQQPQGNRLPLHTSNSRANFNVSHFFNDPQKLTHSLKEHQYVQPVPVQHGARRATYIYDLILQTAEEQQKYFEERQNSLRVLGEVFRQDERLLDPSKINQKTQLVKKLLRQYQGLPLEDQLAATDMLLLDLDYLRKMAGTAVRSQRNALLYEVLKEESLDQALEKQMTGKHSSRFIKLLKEMGEEKVWDSLTL